MGGGRAQSGARFGDSLVDCVDVATQAEAAVFFCVKHSRQKIGRPCVGRKGTVVSLPHWEQVAWVSTRVW